MAFNSKTVSEFNEPQFEQRLFNLKDSQESISSLSTWCLKHHHHHKKIVAAWLRILKKVKIEQRLTLFYLANDVIQYSKRKGYEFVESWGTALQKATTMVRDDKVRNKILRLFKIWDERSVYDEAFLMDLSGLLSSNPKKPVSTDPADFQPTSLFSKIRSCKNLEEDTDLKLKDIKDHPQNISDIKALNATMKVKIQVKSECDDLSTDIDDGISKIERYIKALEVEIKERSSLIDLLEASEAYYETQRGEAKIVCNAYRNFGSRVKSLKRKLTELISTLPSPLPSPDVNAPSPSPESDIDLPEDNGGTEYYNPHMSNYTNYQPNQTFYTAESNNAYESVNYNSNDSYGYSVANSRTSYSSAPPVPPVAPVEDSSVISQAGFSSFMGNFNLPLDIQKTLFKQDSNAETPASPPIDQQIGEFLDSPDDGGEGKPIEVISSTAKPNDLNFNVSEFLKSLMPSVPDIGGNSIPEPVAAPSLDIPVSEEVPMVPPPPMPPDMFFKEEFSEPYKKTNGNKAWNSVLPPKFPSWNQPDAAWNVEDTPASPPHYEKEPYVEPIEYNEVPAPSEMEIAQALPSVDRDERRIPFKQGMKDTDHRLLDRRMQSLRAHKDVDHRNLISLTGSPKQDGANGANKKQSNKIDIDYESIPMPPTPPAIPAIFETPTPTKNLDIVESVDMEMSDDEEHASGKDISPRGPRLVSAQPKLAFKIDPGQTQEMKEDGDPHKSLTLSMPLSVDDIIIKTDESGIPLSKEADLFSQTFEIPKPINKALSSVVKDPSIDPILPLKDIFSPPVTPGVLLGDDDAELDELNFSKSFLDETSAFLKDFDSQDLLKDPSPMSGDEQFPADLLDGSAGDDEALKSSNPSSSLKKRSTSQDSRFHVITPVNSSPPVANFNNVRNPSWQNSPRQFRPRFSQPNSPNQFRPNTRGFRPRQRAAHAAFRGRGFFPGW